MESKVEMFGVRSTDRGEFYGSNVRVAGYDIATPRFLFYDKSEAIDLLETAVSIAIRSGVSRDNAKAWYELVTVTVTPKEEGK